MNLIKKSTLVIKFTNLEKLKLQSVIESLKALVSEIQAILNEAPLGSYKVEMGLELRQAMLLNGILFNSEAWHSVTAEDITALEKVDEALL